MSGTNDWTHLRRHVSRRRFLQGAVLGGVAAGLAAVAGCAPQPAAPTPAPARAAPTTAAPPTVAPTRAAPAATAPAAAATAAPVAQATATPAPARKLGTIRFGQAFDLDTLDPTRVVQTPWRRVYGHMFDPLFHRIYKDGQPERVPKLGLKIERVDDTSYIYTLRQGVKFSNGEPFDARTMVFTREKMLDPTSQAAGGAGQIDRIEVLDEYRMKVVMKVSDPFAEDAFVDSFFPVPPKAYADMGGTKEFGVKPIGTGPYLLEEWRKGDRIAMKANPNYWGGAPLAERVIVRVMPEVSTRVDALLNKEVDIVEGLTPLQAQRIKDSDVARVSVAPGSPQPIWVGLMNDRPPLNDKRVRQAINYAVNKEAIVRRVLLGYGEVMSQACASGTDCYNPAVKPYPYDPKKAKELLQAAGHDQIEIPFQFSSGVTVGGKEIVQAIAADLAAVGIKVNPIDVERGAFLRDFTDGIGRHKGFGDIFVMYYAAGIRPQTVALRRVLVSTDSWNAEHYVNPEVDRLIKESDKEFDAEKRKALYYRVAEIVNEDAPWLFLIAPKSIWGVSKSLRWEAQSDDMLWVLPESFPV
ncbi:MAG: ABC transporter substrate-binding protein [Chloroflexi bacterium]|nr:ABC transporter substrate-binding protein [Chloroflexota bacterium]